MSRKLYETLAVEIIHFWRGTPEARIDPTKEVNRYPVLHEQIRRACCDVSCARMSEVEAKAREMGLPEMEAWAKAEREKWAEGRFPDESLLLSLPRRRGLSGK